MLAHQLGAVLFWKLGIRFRQHDTAYLKSSTSTLGPRFELDLQLCIETCFLYVQMHCTTSVQG